MLDGKVPRKGSAKAPFLVSGEARLHEVASMAWSGVLGAETPTKSKGAGRAKSPCEWGSGERDSSDDPWFGAGGEGRLQVLRVMER